MIKLLQLELSFDIYDCTCYILQEFKNYKMNQQRTSEAPLSDLQLRRLLEVIRSNNEDKDGFDSLGGNLSRYAEEDPRYTELAIEVDLAEIRANSLLETRIVLVETEV